MPPPSKFYAASEDDALAWLSQRITLDLTTVSTSPLDEKITCPTEPVFAPGAGGRMLDEPLFKPLGPKQSAKPAKGPQLRVIRSAQPLYRDEPHSNNIRGRVFDNGDNDSDVDDPDEVLADMDYQFAKWTHERREGVDSIPFVMAGAPSHTHSALAAQAHADSLLTAQRAGRSSLDPKQNQLKKRIILSALSESEVNKREAMLTDCGNKASNTSNKDTGVSKIATQIAKSKAAAATTGSTILATQSASQKRAALQKSKKMRKPIQQVPASTSMAEKPFQTEEKAPAKEGQKLTILRYDDTPEGYLTALNHATKQGLVDPKDDKAIEKLMQDMKSLARTESKGDDTKSGGEVKVDDTLLEEGMIDDGLDDKQVVRTRRLKGKARKEAKKASAK